MKLRAAGGGARNRNVTKMAKLIGRGALQADLTPGLSLATGYLAVRLGLAYAFSEMKKKRQRRG